MRAQNIDSSWFLVDGLYNFYGALRPDDHPRVVDLPHDYMIETDTDPDSPSGTAGAFYNTSVKTYYKNVLIPAEWADEEIFLDFDGVMMNATVEINGAKVALQHYGYAPFCVNITEYVYPGKENRVSVVTHPATQPNCRWYSGAGIFRSLNLVHGPKVHIAKDGIYGYTEEVVRDENGKPLYAIVKVQVEVENRTMQDHIAYTEVSLIPDGQDEAVVTRKNKVQVNAASSAISYLTFTVDDPAIWDLDTPNLYRLTAKVTDGGIYRTHETAIENPTVDEAEVLFGIRTVKADPRRGLLVNGRSVKLKGGCLHHDNGMLGAVSLYDTEYRKLSHMKATGFNAVRTTHNPPSRELIEAADRLGMYIFDEAFDAWSIMKQPGDYNMFFDTDWKKDLGAFLKRDRSHACVILWSTGNEIPERGGMNRGYTRAAELAEFTRSMDASRPISNAICSFWSGLDDDGMMKTLMGMKKKFLSNDTQNMKIGDEDDTSWEDATEAFANGLDIVGYNYMEQLYPKDHRMYPDRIILGSENYPKEIGIRWPMIESTDHVIGDFTWTAYDYLGEAGIGRSAYMEADDPRLAYGAYALTSQNSGYPWRTANDADFDINGSMLPQGAYRSVVWGSDRTYLYSYDPACFGKAEVLSAWGFPDVRACWNWEGCEGQKVNVMVFTAAEEVELFLNGKSIAKKAVDGAGMSGLNLPRAVLFETVYEAGELTAVSCRGGEEISRDTLWTTGAPAAIRLTVDSSVPALKADCHSMAYVSVEIVDADGATVPNANIALNASVSGPAVLAAFGSAAPQTTENYTKGSFTSYRGRATAILRGASGEGDAVLTVSAEGLETVSVKL